MTNMLDEKDKKILKELRSNSRQTTKSISEKIKIPRVTVHERIQKMVEKGVIKKFTAIPDFSKTGQPFIAFIFLKLEKIPKVSQRVVGRKVAKIPGIFEIHVVAGEHDLLLKARGESLAEMSNLIIDKLREIEGVSNTFTMAVFETIKEEA